MCCKVCIYVCIYLGTRYSVCLYDWSASQRCWILHPLWLLTCSIILLQTRQSPELFHFLGLQPGRTWTQCHTYIYIQLAIKSHRKYFWSQGLRSFASFNCHTNRNWILAAELKERPFHQVKNQPYLKPDPLSILYLLHLSHMHSEHFQQDFGQQVTLCSKGQHRIYPTIRKNYNWTHAHHQQIAILTRCTPTSNPHPDAQESLWHIVQIFAGPFW